MAEIAVKRSRPAAAARPRRAVAEAPLALGAAGRVQRATAPVLLALFFISILLPIYFQLGETRLSPNRLVLLASFPLLFLRLFGGRAGRVMAIDVLMVLYGLWIVVTLTYNHGLSRLPLAGITVVEQLGGYLIGRVLIRNATDYRLLLRFFLFSLIVLCPFTVIELFTGQNLVQEIFRPVFPTYFKGDSAQEGRLGLERVMSGFEHPILYGLFCSLGVANFLYLAHRPPVQRLSLAGFSSFMTFASLSSAPLMAVAMQFAFCLWDWITKGRWWLLTLMCALFYVTIDLLSNRTPLSIVLTELTFNPLSAWTRVMIWEYGSAAMFANPVFGIGLNDWPRPPWLTTSVDNFWLLTGMRHGVVGVLLMMTAAAAGFAAILRTRGLSADLGRTRTGYLLALLGLYITLATVHIWGSTSSFMMFYIGAGIWLCGAGQAGPEAPAEGAEAPRQAPEQDPPGAERQIPYSRFTKVRPTRRGR